MGYAQLSGYVLAPESGRCGWITSFLRKKKVEAVLLLSIVGLSSNLNLLVAMRLGVTPVPIPNTMVKT